MCRMISVPDHASIQPQYPITYSIQSTLPRAWIFNTTQLANLVVFAGFPKSAVSPYRPPSPVSSPVTTDQRHPVMASPPLQEQWQRSPVPTCNSGTGAAFLGSPRTPLWPGPSWSSSQPAQRWDSSQSLYSIPVRLPPHRTTLNGNEFRLLALRGKRGGVAVWCLPAQQREKV